MTVSGEVTKPVITSIFPSSGRVGTQVTITGENFGSTQGNSTVTFNGVDAGSADSWSDTEIKIKVPLGAKTGSVVVTVCGQASNNDKTFTVKDCFFADLDCDGDVDIVDIQLVAGRWGAECDNPEPQFPDYVPEYDIDQDCDIDIMDIQKVATHYGETEPFEPNVVVDSSGVIPAAQISIEPPSQKLMASETNIVKVKIENVTNLGAFEFTLRYDNKIVQISQAADVQLGDFLGSTKRTMAIAGSKMADEQSSFSYGAYSYGEADGPNGGGILVHIPLTAVGVGHTAIELVNVQLADTAGNPIPVSTISGTVSTTPNYGDVSGDGEVTAYDAALVLRRVIGMIEPDDANFPYLTLENADVTGDNTISALDAALILQYSANKIDQFPVEGQSSSPMRNPLSTVTKVSIADIRVKLGERVIVPIKLENAHNALALKLTLNYDSRVLKFVRMSDSEKRNNRRSVLSQEFNQRGVLLHGDGIRSVNIALATATKIFQGEIIHLEFEVLTKPALHKSHLELIDVYLNEGVTPQLKHGLVTILPNQTALLQNYPNPFNPETWIPFQLSDSTEVSISIYSTSGRLVRNIELGRKEGGFYTSRSDAAYWNGRNQIGEKVGSGVYFYTLNAGDFQAVRKLLVVK